MPPKARPKGHRPVTRRLTRIWGLGLFPHRRLSPVTRPRPAMASPVVQLVLSWTPPPPIYVDNSHIPELDLGPAAFEGPVSSHIESRDGGYINYYPRCQEAARRAELGRRRARTRRLRNAGVGAARGRWVWKNGKGGNGKRRERRRDEKGRFI